MISKSDRYEMAESLYSSGLSIQNVADFYGVTRQAMWMILKRRGCEFRDQLKYGKDNHFYRDGMSAPDRIHNLTEVALGNGTLQRKTHCEKCKETSGKIGAHHPDYNRPLNVIWLCKKCHFEWHKKNKAIELSISFPPMPRTEIGKLGGKNSHKNRKEVSHEELQQAEIESATTVDLLTAGVP